ncbi:hypothetical protein D3C75_753910 [compost metagenome]
MFGVVVHLAHCRRAERLRVGAEQHQPFSRGNGYPGAGGPFIGIHVVVSVAAAAVVIVAGATEQGDGQIAQGDLILDPAGAEIDARIREAGGGAGWLLLLTIILPAVGQQV